LRGVLSALSDRRVHIPYRDHKLTSCLRDSLGGTCKTMFIVNIQTTVASYEETMHSLYYAEKAKTVENKVALQTPMKVSKEGWKENGRGEIGAPSILTATRISN
jgi:hypothetical protein